MGEELNMTQGQPGPPKKKKKYNRKNWRKAGECEHEGVEVSFEHELLIDGTPIDLTPDPCRSTGNGSGGRPVKLARKAICVRLLAAQVPVAEVCRLLHMREETVKAIAAQNGARLAEFSERYACGLLGMGMAAFAVADTKKQDARYAELMVGGGILTDKALQIKIAMAGSMEDEKKALDVEVEDPELTRARAFLEAKQKAKELPELKPGESQ